jgi:preprotein translocase subunit SecF
LRATMEKVGLKTNHIQRYGQASDNEVLISLEEKETSEQALDQGKNTIIKALETGGQDGKQDLNNVGFPSIAQYLLTNDPLHLGTDAQQKYNELARAIVDYRDKAKQGVLNNVTDVSAVAPPAVVQSLQNGFFTSNFGVRNVDIIGPTVGKQLQNQALLATLYSLAGMLIYLWFRFELIYGVAAVVAVFHDTIITVGLFSILNVEMSLTVIAAILTLIGYSMNDTIVVFDRIRENVKLLRRDSLSDIVNKSINQTLSRTVLTSGLTFLTVLSLFIFGGEVLHGFSLALVIGILIGTYSSIFIAAPMLVAYQGWRAAKGSAAAPVTAAEARKEKARVKA